jgi:hypothetical protein
MIRPPETFFTKVGIPRLSQPGSAMSCSYAFSHIRTGSASGAGGIGMENKAILLVEDDPDIRSVLMECLEFSGFTVIDVETAETAARVLEQEVKFVAVVTDINLGPGANGIVLADQVHRLCPQIPVVFITGRLDMLRDRGIRSDEFVLPKPFSLSALIGIIDRFGRG